MSCKQMEIKSDKLLLKNCRQEKQNLNHNKNGYDAFFLTAYFGILNIHALKFWSRHQTLQK